MWVSRYLVWLVVYSVAGWLYESTYATINEGHWENRGFLYGPLCPIYGTGAVLIFAAWSRLLEAGIDPSPLHVFVGVAIGSAVLEYLTSWALEQLFHARWWDYTNMPLNVNGRICVPATVLFGLAGLLATYVLYEPTVSFTDTVPPVAIEALSIVLTALVSADATLTVSSLTTFAQTAAAIDRSVNAHMDRLVSEAGERGALAAEALAEERDRFAASLRASRLGEMSVPVRAAISRARIPQAAGNATAEFARLWNEVRRR